MLPTKRDILEVAVLGFLCLFGIYSCKHNQSGPEANRTVKSWTDLGVSTGSIKTSRFHRTVTISPEVTHGLDSTAPRAGEGSTRLIGGRTAEIERTVATIRLDSTGRNLDLKWDLHTGKLTGRNYGFDFRPGINIFKSLDEKGVGLDIRLAHAWKFGAQVGVEAFQKSKKVKPSISIGYNLSYIKLRNTDIVVTYAFKDVLLGLRVEL